MMLKFVIVVSEKLKESLISFREHLSIGPPLRQPAKVFMKG